MTRETKIGLLVGLAFILVIGILLSDHIHGSSEIPQADMTDFGNSVRSGTSTPGEAAPHVTMVVPSDAPPTGSVPTHDELAPRVVPVVPSQNYSPVTPRVTRPESQTAVAENRTPVINPGEDHGADAPDNRIGQLANAAQQHGETLVRVPSDGSAPVTIEQMPPRQEAPAPVAQVPAPVVENPAPVAVNKSYKAQPGDSVSRMAARFMSGNTRANRQAIIDANPSLREDPDRIILGKSYVIPAAQTNRQAVAVISPESGQPQTAEAAPAPAPTPVAKGETYTVQEGDSLWRIANDDLGDASEVDAIKDLNRNVLKGANHDVVVPGMTLRLPGKKMASAN